MPLPLAAVGVLSKVGGFFGGLLKSPWFYAALAFIAVGTGTFFYLKHDKENAVEQATITATENANTNATIRSYETQGEITERVIVIDQNYAAMREQTAKDYANARSTVQNAPVEERDAQAPALLIDTLNELDRLHQARRPDRVHQSESPVG